MLKKYSTIFLNAFVFLHYNTEYIVHRVKNIMLIRNSKTETQIGQKDLTRLQI